MTPRKAFLFVAALSAALLAVVVVPDLRLDGQLAAARKEGLWTTGDDVRRAIGNVPGAENAAPLVWKAIEADHADRRTMTAYRERMRVADDKASPAEREVARKALPLLKESLARWRAASERPRLDYHRRYEDGYRTLFPELASLRAGAMNLVAAANLSESPKANLLAAARLSALVRQEPGTISQLVGMSIGKAALREASKRGLQHEIAVALGPDADVRRILGPDLYGLLDSYSGDNYERALTDLGVKGGIGLSERLGHWGPFAKNAKASGIARWRRLWGRLPRDGTNLDAAAPVLDAEMPGIDALTPSVAGVVAKLSGGGRGDTLREIAAFEREKRKAL